MKNRHRQNTVIQRLRVSNYAGEHLELSGCRNSTPSHHWHDSSWTRNICREVTVHVSNRFVLPLLLASLALGLVLRGSTPVAWAADDAPQDSPSIAKMQVGLGGDFKVGYWTPVRVTIRGGSEGFSGKFELSAPDGDDLATRYTNGADRLLEIPAGGEWTGWRYFKLGRIDGRVRGVLRDREGTIVDQQSLADTVPRPATWHWVVTMGADVRVDESAALFVRMRSERLVSSLVSEPEDFPDQWFGYEGVNVVVVATGVTTPLETMSDQQFEAFLHWLRLGGRLVLTSGKRAPELFAPDHRFYPLRPGEFIELDEFWKASGLENYARAADRILGSPDSPLAIYSAQRGRVTCYEGAGGTDDRAIITRFPIGFGEVTYLAIDLDLPPVSTWPSRPRLLAKLLQPHSDEEDSALSDESVGQVTHVGFDDVSGQLRAALDQFQGVTLVQFSWVAALLVLYVLVLGPVDFFGLRKLQRFHWTWVTFPFIVVGFCLLAVWLSGHWKGLRTQLNQIDVVDVDPAEQWVRGTTWASIYSPQTTRLDVDLAPEPALQLDRNTPEVLLSWHGLPGTGLGGMNTTTTVDVLSEEYRINYGSGRQARAGPPIEQLPIHTASTKGLIARWEAHGAVGEVGQLTANRQDLLQGTVTNPLDVELSNAWVFFGNWAYPIDGRFGPGETFQLGGKSPLDLSWLLARRRIVGTRDEGGSWNHDDLSDPPRIVEMLMFYSAAGGRPFTRLSHSYQGYIDLSRHLREGQAILVGRSRLPASRLTISHSDRPPSESNVASGSPLPETQRNDINTPVTHGQPADTQPDATGPNPDQHWTFYRILLPVTLQSDT